MHLCHLKKVWPLEKVWNTIKVIAHFFFCCDGNISTPNIDLKLWIWNIAYLFDTGSLHNVTQRGVYIFLNWVILYHLNGISYTLMLNVHYKLYYITQYITMNSVINHYFAPKDRTDWLLIYGLWTLQSCDKSIICLMYSRTWTLTPHLDVFTYIIYAVAILSLIRQRAFNTHWDLLWVNITPVIFC